MVIAPIRISAADVKRLAPGSSFLPFAHHPHCDRHSHHLIWVAGRPLCLGCTGLYFGVPLGAVAAWWWDWHGMSLVAWMVLHWILLAPTALQPFVQKKLYKICSRVLLGVACGSYFVSGLFKVSYFDNAWLWRFSVLLAFGCFFSALYLWRLKHFDDPCVNCPLGRFPTCDWNMPRLLAANPDDALLGKIAAQAGLRR
jgi:hypothetical protein